MTIIMDILCWWLSVGASVYFVCFLQDAVGGFKGYRGADLAGVIYGLLGIPVWPLPLYGLRDLACNQTIDLLKADIENRKLKNAMKIYEGPRLTSAGKAIKFYQEENAKLKEQLKQKGLQ
jgi:hypothetical protein